MLLTTELLPAGAERVVYEIATRVSPGWQVLVCSLRSPGGDDGAVARALTDAGVEVLPLRFQGKADWRGAIRLTRALRRFEPHVVHAHLFHANLAARLLGRLGGGLRTRPAIASTIHIVERRRLPLRLRLERWTACRDDVTVCVSAAVARFARDALGVRASSLRVIRNGIDLERYAAPHDPATAREALGLPADALVIGAVGRLDPQKGVLDLVEAFARLADRHSGARLVLAGVGPQEAKARQRVERRGLQDRVAFLGFRNDVPRVLAALDVFCMPSRWEGFGLSLAEALAAGKPAVVSDVDSLPEVLGDAGVTAPPADPARLADAIDRLLVDPALRADLARRARARATRFRVERMVADYEALYEQLSPESGVRSPEG